MIEVAGKQIYKAIVGALMISGLVVACKKEDPAKSDGRLNDNHYCNQPDAVNYNVNFPGIPDNTICYFPTQLFKGDYLFRDSTLDRDLKFLSLDSFDIRLVALTTTKMALLGFMKAQPMDSIPLTADRYYKAVVDSAPGPYDLKLYGSLVNNGSYRDTLTGYIQKYPSDSNKVLVRFTVIAGKDSAITYHHGTAIKL